MNGVERSNDGVTLLKCPFCGGEARLQRWRKKSDYYVICKECGCRTPLFQYQFDSKEERRKDAINAWNTRKPVENVIERLEEQAEECKKYWDEFDDEDAFGRMNAYMNSLSIIKEEVG